MTEHDELQALRDRAARLEGENLRLRGRRPARAGSMELLSENVRLRRRVEALRAKMPRATFGPGAAAAGKGDRTHLTVHEVASRLNTTAREVRRMFAGKVPVATDAHGVWVIRRDDFERAVVEMGRRRDPARFL